MASLFSLTDVRYAYPGSVPALSGISLEFQPGERTVILGANGTGKSTLLEVLDGLVFPQSGSITAFGRALTEQALGDPAFSADFRKRVGLVFQNPDVQLFSPTVWEEVAFGPLQLGLAEQEIRDRVDRLLDELRLQDLRDRAPHRLSEGQKKKVAIASSLAVDPEVLLLDEPTNGLDPRTQVWLIDLLTALHERGTTIITATHDLSIAEDIADRAVVLAEDHSLAAVGRFADVMEDEDLLLRVNLIHEHAHVHGGVSHVHRHGHFGHYHANGGSTAKMHKGHGSHTHDHGHDHGPEGTDTLRKLQAMLEHWIEHGDSHAENYREWARKAENAGEEEISREIHLAIEDHESLKEHLKRAKALLAAKLVLRK